ncbi:peptidoglycan DD-metalloendopeptidase family protein [Cupriavidus agavae]|uniref:LysM domain-containing protein n=1 Tax=Cupriavidus agavae TaxID=1001822 RepID=A0A4Q7S853_9BURK|nr:peptidoglycan DD-metalloendopeptidase family protein [Cupriavidus agavae]RZT42575.1 LysM domain-containing protein [Cupriavidus agavae]
MTSSSVFRPKSAARRLAGSLAAVSVAVLLAACGTTPSEPAPEGYYRVERGDTLYSIARRNGRSVAELARWSNISDTSQIEVGQLVRIKPPAGAGISAAKAGAGPAVADKPEKPAAAEPAPSKPPASAISLQWPADGRVTGRFAPPAEKGLRIEVPAGGKVRAAASGWAIHVGTLRGYGQLVIIKHNDDWLTVYGNLDKTLVKEGARVAVGQELGSMNNASELHFEVRGNGKPVNPASYLPSR